MIKAQDDPYYLSLLSQRTLVSTEGGGVPLGVYSPYTFQIFRYKINQAAKARMGITPSVSGCNKSTHLSLKHLIRSSLNLYQAEPKKKIKFLKRLATIDIAINNHKTS